LSSAAFTDLEIAADDKKGIAVHRAVLSAASDFLRAQIDELDASDNKVSFPFDWC